MAYAPDFIPVLGYLDDVILLPVLIATVRLIPKSQMDAWVLCLWLFVKILL